MNEIQALINLSRFKLHKVEPSAKDRVASPVTIRKPQPLFHTSLPFIIH